MINEQRQQFQEEYSAFGVRAPLSRRRWSNLEPAGNQGLLPNFAKFPFMPNNLADGQTKSRFVMANGLYQSQNYIPGELGWKIDAEGNAEFQNVSIGQQIVTTSPSLGIQFGLDELNPATGGVLQLRPGSYFPGQLDGISNLTVIGSGQGNTFIDFASQNNNWLFQGTNVYTTGTIVSITSGVMVTGSGTSWLANASAGQYLFIGTRWYLIAAVTGNTTLVLAEAYADNVTLPANYRIATIIQNVRFENLTVRNSGITGLEFMDARNISFQNVTCLANDVGISFENISLILTQGLIIPNNVSDGAQFTNVGLCNVQALNTPGNGGNGVTMNNCKTLALFFSSASGNGGNGYDLTSCDNNLLQVEANGNGDNGIECVSACNFNFINNGFANGNVNDGVKLTATSDFNTIGSSQTATDNGGYGVNIAAASDDENYVIAIQYDNNTTGDLQDNGTGTKIIT